MDEESGLVMPQHVPKAETAPRRLSSRPQELQRLGLMSAPWDWPPRASWAPGLLWSEDFGTGASLCCVLLLALCWQCYGEWEECR